MNSKKRLARKRAKPSKNSIRARWYMGVAKKLRKQGLKAYVGTDKAKRKVVEVERELRYYPKLKRVSIYNGRERKQSDKSIRDKRTYKRQRNINSLANDALYICGNNRCYMVEGVAQARYDKYIKPPCVHNLYCNGLV